MHQKKTINWSTPGGCISPARLPESVPQLGLGFLPLKPNGAGMSLLRDQKVNQQNVLVDKGWMGLAHLTISFSPSFTRDFKKSLLKK